MTTIRIKIGKAEAEEILARIPGGRALFMELASQFITRYEEPNMEHVFNPKAGVTNNSQQCIICDRRVSIREQGICPGPTGIVAKQSAAAEADFAAKIRTLSIHPKGR